MTDSLARIRAERDADTHLLATHPDPLAIVGDVATRAADRCARKRALWAATDPSKRANQLALWDNTGSSRVDETAPTGVLVTLQPGPDHDSTPEATRRNRG